MQIKVSCIAGLKPALESRRPEQICRTFLGLSSQIHALESYDYKQTTVCIGSLHWVEEDSK